MIESPKSLTATIHISFHYEEAETESTERSAETLNKLFQQASGLAPASQELLIKFADCLQETGNKTE